MTFWNSSPGRRLRLGLAAAGSLACSACGAGDDGEARYKVSGTVTYQGAYLAHGDISFVPVDLATGRAASSTIDNGSYTLSTLGDRDGALPGQYKVTVISKDVDLTQIKPAPGRSRPNPGLVGKANRAAKSLTPKKYESSQTSPLTAEVKPQSNSLSFELTD